MQFLPWSQTIAQQSKIKPCSKHDRKLTKKNEKQKNKIQ